MFPTGCTVTAMNRYKQTTFQRKNRSQLT